MTLDPRSHVDPIGTVLIPLSPLIFSLFAGGGIGFLGGFRYFGWAKPVPINPTLFMRPKRDTLLVSVAGPASNLVMAFIFGFVLVGFSQLGAEGVLRPLMHMLAYGVSINLALAFFNLIPVPPLDGSRILASILNRHFEVYQFDRYGTFVLLFLIVLAPYLLGFSPVGLWISFFARPIASLISGLL